MPTNSAGRNWKHTKESSLFGTRKLAFYTLTADSELGLVGAWTSQYSFRVNTSTGVVSNDADISERNIAEMYPEFYNNSWDDDSYELETPWTISFLGNTGNWIYINTNSGLSFWDGDTSRGGPAYNEKIGIPEIFIANNDGNMQGLYTETLGDSGYRTYRVKFLGNTDWHKDNNSINLIWEVVFYEEHPEYIDFLVTRQPTDWNDYDQDGPRRGKAYVTWGVTDGSSWVDGLSTHNEQNAFAPFTSTTEELWKQPNSVYQQVLQALQQAGAELYWVGKPQNGLQPHWTDWTALPYADDYDYFTFAIADDADVPVATQDEVWSADVLTVGLNDPYTFDLGSTPPAVYIGQRVTFTGYFGDYFGGVVAGKDYYVKDKGTWNGDKTWITVSETANPEVLDIVLPQIVGGEPGPVFEAPTNLNPGATMTAQFFNYDVEWQGTAGDVLSSCCSNITTPGVSPQRLWYFISQSGAFSSGNWWMERSNPSYGIFPSSWQGNIGA